ncbi:MAG TPA: hypothetical protein DIW31_11675 [Bacteroidales bacterium]|nr:hypothetical protein [Bacteroidales bacterium]
MIKRIIRIILIVAIAVLAITGIYGGVALLLEPSGSNLALSINLLESTIFGSYIVPGLILLILLGFFPTLTVFGLITRKKLRFANKLNIYKKRHWAWTYSLYCGLLLVLWIDVQVMMIGGGYILQSIYAILGVVIIILTLTPSIMKFYKKK